MTPGLLERTPTLAQAVAEVLDEAAIRIEREGFAQHHFWDAATGLYCTRGTYTQVVLDRYRGRNVQIDGVDLWQAVIEACDLALSSRLGRGVAVWNDEPGRTTDEVVEVLKNTAAGIRVAIA